MKCFKCRKKAHLIAEYMSNLPTCYNCGEQGHISVQCQKPKNMRATIAQTNGRLFSLSGADVSKSDNLI